MKMVKTELTWDFPYFTGISAEKVTFVATEKNSIPSKTSGSLSTMSFEL